jgi:hypothetical protein
MDFMFSHVRQKYKTTIGNGVRENARRSIDGQNRPMAGMAFNK